MKEAKEREKLEEAQRKLQVCSGVWLMLMPACLAAAANPHGSAGRAGQGFWGLAARPQTLTISTPTMLCCVPVLLVQALTEQLRAATQASSGLTLSLNATSIHPATTQDVSQAAGAPKAPAGRAAAAAESVGGSCGPGVSNMRQQLHVMHLVQDSPAHRDGSGGGSAESAGAGASVAQPRQQGQGQEEQQVARQGSIGPAGSAGEAAGSTGAVAATGRHRDSPVEEVGVATPEMRWLGCQPVQAQALSIACLSSAEPRRLRQQAARH